jgi:hypothetical protein
MIVINLTETDKVFLSKINRLSGYFEDIIDKSLNYKINFMPGDINRVIGKVVIIDRNNNRTNVNYTVIAMYNNTSNEFIWNKHSRDRLKPIVLNTFTHFNVDSQCINKFFNADSIILDNTYKYSIAYIVAIVFKQHLNLIRFNYGDIDIYIIIDLNLNSNLSDDIINEKLI